jgi:hypothetical protein
MKPVAVFALITFAAASEGRLRALEQRVDEKIAALEAENAAMKAAAVGRLEMFADGRTTCPAGYRDPNITQGMVLVGRPKNGNTGAVFNRPFDDGEIGRTPAHSHSVSVNDPGHTHVGIVNDPGHGHNVPMISTGSPGSAVEPTCLQGEVVPGYGTTHNKTGITVDNLHTKSAIEVSIDTNEVGEHNPLVYVLICQKLP